MKEKRTWKNIKRCAPYFLKNKKELIILILLSLYFAVIDSLFPAFIAKVLEFATSGKLDEAIFLALIIIVVALINNFFDCIPFNNSFVKLQNLVSNNIRKDVISSYFEIENKELINNPSGIFLTRITQDPDNIVSAFNTIRGNISTILSNLFVVVYIFYIHWTLGIICLIGTFLVYLIEKNAMNKWNEYKKRKNKFNDRNTTIINEGIKGVRDIKLLNIVNYFKDKTFNNIDELYYDTIKSHKVDGKITYLRMFVVDFLTFAVIILSILYVKNSIISISGVIALFMYKDRLFSSVLHLAWSERYLKEFSLSADRIFEVIAGDKFKKETFGSQRVTELKGNVEFKDVHFKYESDEVLKGIDFKINDKDMVAIVGRSGSGKTTIINLLSKLYAPTSGKIFIDGYDINDLDKFSLRNNIAVISQKPYLFNMTIKENLLMVSPQASDKQIENICKICEIHDYIMSLPNKYDTLVGEGGVTLSGGECQRIAIARALLMKTNIILFDEATSALDNETQANIQKAINNISSEYTMLIIAHRLSTIKDCNKIIVINDGKICGMGSHKELLKSNKVYKTLYENEFQN